MDLSKKLNQYRKEWDEAKEFCTADVNQSEARRNLARYAEYYSTRKVKNNVVLYMSYWGRGVIDNPYSIFQELLKRDEFCHLQHFWVLEDFEDNRRVIEEYHSFSNVHFVRIDSQEYLKLLCEAKYLINNVSFPSWFIKKKEQIYVNTWHGTPLKSMGFEMVNGRIDSANVVRNFLCADYLLSANDLMTKMYMESYMMKEILPGEIVQEGYPRNDALLHTSREEVLKKLDDYGIKLDRNKKIILYAPTWRQVDASHAVVNPDELLEAKAVLEQNIDTDQYQILIKPHQYVYRELKNLEEYKGLLIPATLDPNEILSIVDILISDYSSIFVDFMVLNRPILFYIPDLKDYIEQRGISISPDQLPGPYSDHLEDIAGYINQIASVWEQYRLPYKRLKNELCACDDGSVSSRIADIIFGKKKEYHSVKAHATKKKLLIATSALLENGITNSYLSLLNQIDYSEWDVTAYVIRHKNDLKMDQKVDDINPNARVLVRPSRYVATLDEEIRKEFCTTQGLYHTVWNRLYPWKALERDFRRNFGDAKFDYIVDFSGYNSTLSPMLACGKAEKKSIWLHNDILADMNRTVKGEKTIWKPLHFNVSIYPLFDHLVSCSKTVMKVNRKKVGTRATYHKFTYASNTVNAERIENGLEHENVVSVHDKTYLVKTPVTQEAGPQKLELTELPGQGINFVTMGRMSTEKNHLALISAFARFHRDHEDSHLFIIGDGPLRNKTENTIRDLDLCDHVTLTGNIDNPFAVMKRCSCFILPSIHEGQPMVLLEARACGLPIIVANFSTVKDSLYPDGQLLIHKDEDSIYQGLCAYANGEVPVIDFDLNESNHKSYLEFIQAIV